MLERIRQACLGLLLIFAYTTPEGPNDKIMYVAIGFITIIYAAVKESPND